MTNTGTKDIYTQVSLTELHKLIPEENYETADVYRIEFTLTKQPAGVDSDVGDIVMLVTL